VQISKQQLQIKFNAERTAYETQIVHFTQKLQDSEQSQSHLIQEIKTLTQLNVEKIQEIEYVKGDSAHTISARTREIGELEARVARLESQELDVAVWKSRWSLERRNFEAEVKKLEDIAANQKKEIANQIGFLEKRKADNQQCFAEMAALKEQALGLEKANRGFQAQAQRAIGEYELMKQEVEVIQKSRDQFQRAAERSA
jgi:hypothetical protein